MPTGGTLRGERLFASENPRSARCYCPPALTQLAWTCHKISNSQGGTQVPVMVKRALLHYKQGRGPRTRVRRLPAVGWSAPCPLGYCSHVIRSVLGVWAPWSYAALACAAAGVAFFGYMNLHSLSLPTFNCYSTRAEALLCNIMD